MRFRFVEAEKAIYPVRLLCRCLAISRAGYYAWRKRPASNRAREDAQLAVEIRASHAESRRAYGSPRVLRDLRDLGRRVSRKRVARLMRELGLVARRRRRFQATTDSKHVFPVAANVLMRNFEVSAPNTAWVTDITYVATAEGWLYLAVILDLFSRRVVGFALSERIDRELVLEALRRALERNGITCSMSRRGNCWDNAVAESFFGTLKVELLHERPLSTRANAEHAITDYIENFYNVRRRHSSLGYQSPLVFELRHARGERGGSAPAPPFIPVGGRSQEVPGLGA